MKYLLDTNICVYFLRGNHMIANQIKNVGWESCYISEVTFAELLYGAECSDSKKFNERTVLALCECLNVLPISDVIVEFAHQKTLLRKQGNLIEDSDLWIATTAVVYEMIMVTENVKHLGRVQNIRIEQWYKGSDKR